MKFTKKVNLDIINFDYHGVDIPVSSSTLEKIGAKHDSIIAIASDAMDVDLNVETFLYVVHEKEEIQPSPLLDMFQHLNDETDYIDVSNFVEVQYDSFTGDEWTKTIQYYDVRGNKI